MEIKIKIKGGVTPIVEKQYQKHHERGRRGIVPDCTCTSAPSCVDARRYVDSPVNRNRSYSLSSTAERSAVKKEKERKKGKKREIGDDARSGKNSSFRCNRKETGKYPTTSVLISVASREGKRERALGIAGA